MSTLVPFGEWLPDLPPLGLQGCTVATNLIPGERSYRPFPKLVPYASALPGAAQGGIVATDAAGNNYNYVGNASALYTLVGQSYTDATRISGGAYTVQTEDFWEFVNWGNTVIGVHGLDDSPQQISLGAAKFINLPFGTVTGKHIATMRDFVVLGNVSDSAANAYRVRWCAINNPNSWTADATTLADYQDLPSDGGPVQKILGGEYGVVLQKKAIWRMLFVGSPLVFQFDKVHSEIGAFIPQAAVRYQNLVFFYSEEGFYAFDGSQLDPIGRGKVDNFFKEDYATDVQTRIHAVVDPANKLVLWAYPSHSTVGGNPDKLLCYSWAFQRWTLIEGLNIELLLQSVSTGTNLDSLDSVSGSLDDLPWSLDSSQWTGGEFILSAFNASHQLSRFNGSAMATVVESGEFQLFKDNRAMLTSVRPDVDGLSASMTIAIVNRNALTESASIGYVATYPNATGYVPVRVSARYFRIRLETAEGVEFTHLMASEVEGTQAGVR